MLLRRSAAPWLLLVIRLPRTQAQPKHLEHPPAICGLGCSSFSGTALYGPCALPQSPTLSLTAGLHRGQTYQVYLKLLSFLTPSYS
ncbi:hypothetical protein C8R47DRAFT_1099877 [Mycena vitilis]|nr:hypothetical protein C8R47DRAFT_1099877 [Mycena vitilis]